MRALLLLAFAVGCSGAGEPCSWEGFAAKSWETAELENGCGLSEPRPEALGCEKQISETVEFDGCSKAFFYRCANGYTLETFMGQGPDSVSYEFRGPDGCVTRRWLVPAP